MKRSIDQLLVAIFATLLLTVGVPVEVLAGYNDYGITATQGGVVIREKTISVNDANVNRTYALFAKLPAVVGEGDMVQLDLSSFARGSYVCYVKQNGNEAGKSFYIKK